MTEIPQATIVRKKGRLYPLTDTLIQDGTDDFGMREIVDEIVLVERGGPRSGGNEDDTRGRRRRRPSN